MRIKKHIRRAIFVSAWAVAGAGVIVLLVAAVNSRNQQSCKGYDIDINGRAEGHWFIDKTDVVNVLTSNKTVSIKNKKIESFDLNKLEARLEKEVWIKDAELYFDNKGILKVKIEEREPVARIFNTAGQSFYIDSTGHRLPLSEKMSARLPVFTSFPGDGRKIKTKTDKKLVQHIKELSLYLLKDPFWMAQVSQIDITPSREFEIVPTIGNHLIEFGDGDDYEKKFHRLFVFYKQVLAKTGMEKYDRIKVQYDKQVIGVKKENNN